MLLESVTIPLNCDIHIELLTHFQRPIQNVILLLYYTMFTWIKISRACQIDMERREKQADILK